MNLRLLFLSTPVGPLGSGIGGGVELALYNIAKAMIERGHQVQAIAPEKSFLPNIPLIPLAGNLQLSVQSQAKNAPIYLPENSVLSNMCDYARQIQEDYDIILNFAYDWLPFYLTPFFKRPFAHRVSMGTITAAMDGIIRQTYSRFPHLVAFQNFAQATTFGITDACHCIGNAVDLSLYQFCEHPGDALAWVGRISPEKALEDAIAASQITSTPLKIFGLMQDEDYWQKLQRQYPNVPIQYMGFLPTSELQQHLRLCRGLLMTPRWVEAFGNVVIEALACGVPVIAYRRGGPGEIVRDGETGFVVEPDSVMGLVEGIKRLDEIDRRKCRQQAEEEYSLETLGDRFEQWFSEILALHLTV